ncbi:MAG TPA: aa3-type cytochrome c oxidase subunit IV [Phenylobacterium sp.]|nr:aa3-type cytochrome c oxidase subunit IV [Phenylobacterium sp.]
MAGQASDYHRGDMDIHEQQATFHLVMGITKWGSLIIASALLFLTLWFCTPAGFLSAFISGAVVLVLGILLLRSRGDAGH